MLLGRASESAAVDDLLRAAASGASASLLLLGEAGIGKTAILRYAQQQAADMTVLQTRGVESESDLAYGALSELLRPILRLRRELPGPQAQALGAALALENATSGDRFASFAATLGLLALAAVERPVLLVVDDAHWLDSASADALLFVARRMGAEGVALLFAARDGWSTPLLDGHLPCRVVTGLDPVATRELLGSAGHHVSNQVLGQLREQTGGNPLAMLELSSRLSPGQFAGADPLPNPLPTSETVEQHFVRQARELPADAQLALLVLAAGDSSDVRELAAALSQLGISPSALEPAVELGLVSTFDGRAELRHPLVRSAIYQAARPADRRSAHRALAGALTGDASVERRAWHQAEAAALPEPEAAEALEQAALAARDRGAQLAAARAFTRAARLSVHTAARAQRLLQAGRALELAGRPADAVAVMEEALELDVDPALRTALSAAHAGVLAMTRSPVEARSILTAHAERLERDDPGQASAMYANAAAYSSMTGDVPIVLELARAACRCAPADPQAAFASQVALAQALVLNGRVGEAREPIRSSARRIHMASHPFHVQLLIQAAIYAEEYEIADELLVGGIAQARATSAPAMLPFLLGARADLDFRLGRWTAAYSEACESVELAEHTGQMTILPFSLVCLARVEAGQGRADSCLAHLELVDTYAIRPGVESLRTYATSARGLLELGRGRMEVALAALEETASVTRSHQLGGPAVVQWQADLIECYVRLGRADDARTCLEDLLEKANAADSRWAFAVAARCRGMLASAEDYESAFADALGRHRCAPGPFELARTELCFGERLRRGRQRAQARQHLGRALEAFERLGARPWAQRARDELAATGLTSRRGRQNEVERLSAQELRVALIAAGGATNREAAASLFLSEKTIEHHLSNVYRKVGVRSRTELSRLFPPQSGREDDATAPLG